MSSTLVSDRHAREAADLRRKQIVTPEGVPLVFTIARAGDRALGFMLDGLLVLIPIGLLLLVYFAGGDGWLSALSMLGVFLLRSGYFMAFELRWQGRTPGKRWMGLRVVDARGGVLEADQVVVRNLTREVETFLPVIALLNPELMAPSGPGWVRALSLSWLLLFLLLPLFNRDRRRIGDFLAGTIVISDPRRALRADLLTRPDASESGPRFSADQLKMYGVYELQVLEDLLRKEARRSEALNLVAKKVQHKIGWRAEAGVHTGSREFLSAFYRAQRRRLEQDLVLGQARERKRRGRLSSDS